MMVDGHDHGQGEQAHSPAADGQVASDGWKMGAAAVAVVLVIWFLVAWLVLDRHVLDAAGESVGTALALGVVVSVIGAMRSR